MTAWRLIEFAELSSTNRYACEHLAELCHGDAIRADIQTAGRGRLNRAWLSHVPGNLCLSLVIKPDHYNIAQLPLANLSQLLAVSTCRVLAAFHTSPTLKWPNDIQLDGRKIAGILAETVTRGKDFLGLVLGIGVNLNLDTASLASIGQPATSLSVQVNRAVNVQTFCDALLREFLVQYDDFMSTGFNLIRDEFLSRSPFLGKSIELRTSNSVLHGTALDVNSDGNLVLQDTHGEIQAVDIAEMFT